MNKHTVISGNTAGRQARRAKAPAEMSLKPRVTAIARDTTEVVRFAGGWLFDKAMAGWDVNVLTLDDDLRSLRILGASAHDLASVLEQLGESAKALDFYAQALAAAPPRDLEAKILSKRGWIFTQSLKPPQPEKAREAFTALLRLDLAPHNADAHAGLGYLAVHRKSPAEAQREAFHGLLHGSGDYLALHNLACIYAELSQTDKGQARQHQDTAIALLRRAVALWRRGGTGPREIDLIREERSFVPLRNREEFNKLLQQ